MEIKNYDSWKLSNPRDREIIVGLCEECGGEIYYQEIYKKTKVGKIHEDCYEDYCDGYFQTETVEGLEGLIW